MFDHMGYIRHGAQREPATRSEWFLGMLSRSDVKPLWSVGGLTRERLVIAFRDQLHETPDY
jgi:hypothetical protein